MEKAEKFKGTLVEMVDYLTRYETDKEGNEIETNYTETHKFGIIGDFDKYKENYETLHEDVKINKLQDNVTLYKVDVKCSNGDLATLHNIRENWAHNKFDYDAFYTKEQIKALLEKDFLVAVKGLQEIDLKDLKYLD